jgi:hypothetical protein
MWRVDWSVICLYSYGVIKTVEVFREWHPILERKTGPGSLEVMPESNTSHSSWMVACCNYSWKGCFWILIRQQRVQQPEAQGLGDELTWLRLRCILPERTCLKWIPLIGGRASNWATAQHQIMMDDTCQQISRETGAEWWTIKVTLGWSTFKKRASAFCCWGVPSKVMFTFSLKAVWYSELSH